MTCIALNCVSGNPSLCSRLTRYAAIPAQLRQLDPAWSTCLPALHGIYDPPRALTATDSADPALTTADSPIITTSAKPSSTPHDPTVTATAGPGGISTTTDHLQTSESSSIASKQASTPSSADPALNPAGSPTISDTRPSSPHDPASTATVEFQTLLTTIKPSQNTVQPGGTQGSSDGDPQDESAIFASDPDSPVPTAPTSLTAGQSQSGSASTQRFSAVEAPQTIAFNIPDPGAQPVPSNALQALAQGPTANVDPTSLVDPIAVVTIGSNAITLTSVSGAVVMGDISLSSGQATVIGDKVISNAGSAIIMQRTDTAISTVLAVFGTQTIMANPSAVVVGISTLTQGQAATISGVVVSVGSSNVAIGVSTVALPAGSQINTAALVSQSRSQAVQVGSILVPLIGSNTAIPTSAGLCTATVVATKPPAITVGGSTFAAGSAGQFEIGSQTLSPGASIVISGTTYSLATSDACLVVNGKTTSLPKATASTTTLTYLIASSSQGSSGTSLPSASSRGTSTSGPTDPGVLSTTTSIGATAKANNVDSLRCSVALILVAVAVLVGHNL